MIVFDATRQEEYKYARHRVRPSQGRMFFRRSGTKITTDVDQGDKYESEKIKTETR